MTDLISIGILTYNAAESVARAVRSAQGQTWPDTEIIVIDDSSDDDTAGIVRDMAREDPRIRLFIQPGNRGAAAARNRVIGEAKGEFIAFFDDDDFSVPDRLLRQHRRITDYERDFARGAPVICHTARTQIYPGRPPRLETTTGNEEGAPAPHGRRMAAHILYNARIPGGNGSMATCSQMARKSVYEAAGGFDEAFRRGEDTELNVRLALAGAHFVGISEPLVVQQMTYGSDKRLGFERLYTGMIYEKHAGFLAEEGRGDFDRRWLEAKFDYLEGKRTGFLVRMLGLFLTRPLASFKRIAAAWPNFSGNRIFKGFYR